jgi:hypothetical protein
MRRLAFLLVPLLFLLPARSDALTVRDVMELTRAGLGDEVLLALIEVDRSVFPIDAATVKALKEAGVSEIVILAMIRSARTSPAPPLPPPDAPLGAREAEPAPPQVVVIEHRDAPQVREVPVAVPVYVPVVQRSHHREDRHHSRSDDRRADAAHSRDEHSKDDKKSREPVYWGTAGTLRPDAWKPK